MLFFSLILFFMVLRPLCLLFSVSLYYSCAECWRAAKISQDGRWRVARGGPGVGGRAGRAWGVSGRWQEDRPRVGPPLARPALPPTPGAARATRHASHVLVAALP